MNLSILEAGEQGGPGPVVRDPASLYRAFEQVKDGRKAKGKRSPLPLLLTVLLLGKLAGEKSINGIVDWVKERKSLLKQQLNWPKGFPVNSTYSQALAHCDGQEVAQAIAQVLVKARAEEQCGRAAATRNGSRARAPRRRCRNTPRAGAGRAEARGESNVAGASTPRPR